MQPILLDMVWPALYVSQALWKFWFLIVGTVFIETFVIKYFLSYSWTKSIIASLVGNCVSGFVGTFILLWAMLFWHLIVDNFVHGTFSTINWIATYVLMCVGSVFFETLAIKLIYKEKIKRLFLPMLTGNFLSYAFIAYVMITVTSNDPGEKRTQTFKFLPSKQKIVLLDNSSLRVDTSTIKVLLNKRGERLNDTNSIGYNLHVSFNKQNKEDFKFEFKILDEEATNGINDTAQDLHVSQLKTEYIVLLEQKNPDTSQGWKKPVITDTIIFKRVIK